MTYDLTKMKFVERDAFDYATRHLKKDPTLVFDEVYAERLVINQLRADAQNKNRRERPKPPSKRTKFHGPVDGVGEPNFGSGMAGHTALFNSL